MTLSKIKYNTINGLEKGKYPLSSAPPLIRLDHADLNNDLL